jgi:hypothetical protein
VGTGGTTPYAWTVSGGALPVGLSLDNATGAITGTPQDAEPASFTVTLTDNSSLSTSASFTLTIGKGSATVTPSAPSTATYGDTVEYSATVTGGGVAPTGTITFTVGSTALCTTGTLSGGTANCNSNLAPAGSDSVTATYNGDTNYQTGTGGTSITVSQAATTTTATVNPSTTIEGTSVTYGVTVTSSAGTPTGSVTFAIGSTTLCTATLSGGTGSCQSSAAGLGTPDTVTASYSGDTNFATSSDSQSLTVNPAPLAVTTTSLSVGYVGHAYSDAVAATGGVHPYTWSVSAGSLPAGLSLDSGTGAITGSPQDAEAADFTVAVTDNQSTIATADLSIVVGAGTPSVTASANPTSATYGDTVTYTATVTGGGVAPTGTITFSVGSTPLCTTGSLSGGTANCDSTFAPGGSDTVTATYNGDDNYVSGAGTTSLSVAKASSTTAPSVSPTTVGQGASVTYSATVSSGAGTPTGSVTFKVGSTTLCTAPLSSGSGNCAATNAPVGFPDTVTATYGGDANFATSNGTTPLTVNPPALTVTTSSLTGGAQGSSYSATLATSGGFGAISWAVTAGSLPAGLSLNSATGKITGTPTAAGTANFTVTATDSEPTPATAQKALSITVAAFVPHGYWLVAGDGGIFNFGKAKFYGSTGNLHLQRPVVGMTPTSDRAGYWMVATDGGMFAFGDAKYHGSIPGVGLAPADSGAAKRLNAPIVAMVASPTGKGYLLVASDGGVFAFGDALFHGSCPGIGGCNGSVIAVVPDAGEKGYWVVTSTGRVYPFGDAASIATGQPGATPGAITGATASATGHGYLIVDSHGDVYAFGDAHKYGSPPAGIPAPIVGIVPTSTGNGYWLMGATGAVYGYGDGPTNLGSMLGRGLNAPIVTAAGF